MKKSIIALGLVLVSGSALANGYSISTESSIHKDGFSGVGLKADFNTCKLYDNNGIVTDGETLFCYKGKQFSVFYEGGDDGFVVATYVKHGNKALMSQTRVGFAPYLTNGFTIGSVAEIPLK